MLAGVFGVQRALIYAGLVIALLSLLFMPTATRLDRRLDIPTLIDFELAEGRIRMVTELPGDRVAWDRFWSD